MDLSEVDILIGLAINGIFTGLGTALGIYLANKHIIEGVEKVRDIIKKGAGKIENETYCH